MAQPLKASPLAIEHHALVALEVTASEADNPGGNHSLRTHRKIERHPDDTTGGEPDDDGRRPLVLH